MSDTYSTPFTKAVLTGLFVGIAATLLCMGYNIYYRGETGFPLTDFINVSSLIFAVNLVFLLIGIVYHVFRLFSKGEVVYVIVFLLLTALFAYLASGIHRSDVPLLNTEFHQLFLPIIIIMGVLAALGIPFLYHNKKFDDNVL